MHSARFVIASIAVWCVLLTVGVREIYGYGAAEPAGPARWPARSALPHGDARPTVVLFVHPADPAAGKQIADLGSLIGTLRDRPQVAVVFVGAPAPRPLWTAAGRIRGATRVVDRDRSEAQRFGAALARRVVVYDRAGVRHHEATDVVGKPTDTRSLLAAIQSAR